MAGVRKKPTKGGLYQAWYTESTGKRCFFTGTHDADETLRMAHRLEDDHRQVRLGYRPTPSSSDLHRSDLFEDRADEYLAWGESQGGRKGKPWSEWHTHKRRTLLRWWKERLGTQTLADLHGVLPRVERELRDLQQKGRAGKTFANYAEGISAFCDWCVKRGYLADDPLKGLAPFDTAPQPQSKRRAMTEEEIARLLDTCALHRRLLVETALFSGLRANELRSLTIGDLDADRSGLILDSSWTKNRESGLQPLPADLMRRLKDFAQSGEADRLYKAFYARRDAVCKAPPRPLLFVPSTLSRDFDKDLKAAGIPKRTKEGKLDFHACRTAYINLVLHSDVSAKDAQTLARHSTPDLTFNVYGRARQDRMAEVVQRIAERVLSAPDSVPSVYRQAVGAETENATPLESQSCVSEGLVELRGIEPLTS